MQKRDSPDPEGDLTVGSLIVALDQPDGTARHEGSAAGGHAAQVPYQTPDIPVDIQDDVSGTITADAAEVAAAIAARDEPTAVKTAAETLSDEVSSALFCVRQTDNTEIASISAAEAQAQYHLTETE